MKGNLKDFSGTEILHLVSLAEKSGTLGVKHRGTNARLSFEKGKLVYAQVDDADGSLASVLERAKRINKQQAEALRKRAVQTGDKQLGLILIQKGYITQADIIRSIKRHAKAVVKQFAYWEEGAFSFAQDSMPDDDRITVPIDLEPIILAISRQQKRDEQLEIEIPSLDVRLKFNERPSVKLKDMKLSQDEWRVLNYVKPQNTIRMIANELNMSDQQIRRIVGGMREAGLIQLVQRQASQQLTAEERSNKRTIVERLINHIQGIGVGAE